MDPLSTKLSGHLGPAKAKASRRKSSASESEPIDLDQLRQFAMAGSTSSHPEGFESIQSLRMRLGVPPQELADHLITKFVDACRDRYDRGLPIPKPDLARCFLSDKGTIVFEDPYTGELIDDKTDDLFKTIGEVFRHAIVTPRAAESRRRDSQTSATLLKQRFDRHDVEETETAGLSAAEKDRRQIIVDQFTDALADRFGKENLQPAHDKALTPRLTKLQPVQVDRRFNWNLVLGVGCMVLVLALVYTGYHIANLRQEQVAKAPRPALTTNDSANLRQDSPVLSPLPPPDPSELRSLERPELSPEDRKKIEESSANLYSNRQTTSSEPDDILDMVAGIAPDGQVDLSSRTTILPDGISIEDLQTQPENLSLDPRANTTTPRTVDDIDALEAMFAENSSADPQASPSRDGDPITPGPPSAPSTKTTPPNHEAAGGYHVALPPVSDTETLASLGSGTPPFVRIESPRTPQFSLRQQSNVTEVTLADEATVVAHLSKSSPSQFRWAEAAKTELAARRLLHARLIDAEGESIFLRPRIETAPYPMAFTPETWNPVWDIRGRLDEKSTRLQFSFDAPETIEWAWIEEFDSSRLNGGTASAVFTTRDSEMVAIGVKMRVRTTDELSLQMGFAGRIDPQFAFQPIDLRSLQQVFEQWRPYLFSAKTKLKLGKEQLSSMSGIAQAGQRRRIAALEDQVEVIEATVNRLRVLLALAEEIHQTVKLNLRLYVQWENEQQTILETITPDAN
ncbi:hypothetical protein [Roseiconus lacunae]|uniref:Uncharacterized protein n=1 Tax=Roseiconus lacunae TaxID=2605694 RepID=A0ABT7PCL6_9BACT|nr:hypothetical protein [Roseiconus lacunae]MDM4014240.1 hypothetical protein [Roseiconus lacunae]